MIRILEVMLMFYIIFYTMVEMTILRILALVTKYIMSAKILKEKRRELIKDLMKSDGSGSVMNKLSPLKRIEEGVHADRKAREKDMFHLDDVKFQETFALPGKPEMSSIIGKESHLKTSSVRSRVKSPSRVIQTASTGALVPKEFGFLSTAIGMSTADMDPNVTLGEQEVANQSANRSLSDLDEVSDIMSKIHTGDDAINFFARFGSETPVRLS